MKLTGTTPDTVDELRILPRSIWLSRDGGPYGMPRVPDRLDVRGLYTAIVRAGFVRNYGLPALLRVEHGYPPKVSDCYGNELPHGLASAVVRALALLVFESGRVVGHG